jgi:putative transposase
VPRTPRTWLLAQDAAYHVMSRGHNREALLRADQDKRLLLALLARYKARFGKRYGFVGHPFQGRFQSPAVQRDGYWLSCGRCIERNPTEAGLASRPWDYAWSSSACYALGREDALLDANPCYEELSPDPQRRRQLWREFVLGEDVREAAVRRGDWAVGEEAFRRRLAPVLGRPAPRRRGRPPKGTTTEG